MYNYPSSQKEASTLAGRLSVLGTRYAWNLSKPDIRSRLAGGLCTAHHARRKGYSDFVQDTGPVMSGQLRLVLNESEAFRVSSSAAQTLPITFGYSQTSSVRLTYRPRFDRPKLERLANSLMELDYRGSREMAKSLISSKSCTAVSRYNLLNISENAVGVCRKTKHEQYSGLEVPTKSAGSWWDGADLLHEKGNAANAALWMNSFLNHEENQYSPVLDDGRNPDLAYENFVGQPFGSMPRRLSSLRPNVLSQLAKLIPASEAATSNCAFSSGVMRILNWGDCPSPLGLLSRLIVDKWSPIKLVSLAIGGHLSTVKPIKTTPPKGITSTRRGLTNHVNRSNAMAKPQCNQTRPKFQYRFLALSATDSNVIHIIAPTEREAREQSPTACVMVFAGRLPVLEVSHV